MSKIQNRTELIKNHINIYVWLKNNNLTLLNKHLPLKNKNKPRGYWTFEKCETEAIDCKNINELKIKNKSAHHAAYLNNWLNKIFKRNHSTKKKVKNLDTGQMFLNAREAANFFNRSRSSMRDALKNGTKSGGYRWSYCDDKGNIIK